MEEPIVFIFVLTFLGLIGLTPILYVLSMIEFFQKPKARRLPT